jgi:O-acetyl-ADP-ribose deacetylase (regulator of RNase III)
MSYKEISGNLFSSKAQALVNTVNCVGVMGKGIALEFRRRFPEMFKEYLQQCSNKEIKPGNVYYYPHKDKLILNFAIKDHWKYPSKIEWVESCLKQFLREYKQKGITSVAFPWMGAMNGRIPLHIIKNSMRTHLQYIADIDIEVFDFDTNSPDPLFAILEIISKSQDADYLANISNIPKKYCIRILEGIREGEVNSLYQLTNSHIIGSKSIDKLYSFLAAILDGNLIIPKRNRLF